ncbi:15037_t:CDS:2, partial [Dentiscutata heterogama]
MPQKSKIWDYWRTLPLNELSQLDSFSETSSNDEDDTEDVVSSSTNTQDQEGSKKLHPPVQCKYCPKKFKHGLATHMQKHTNDCLNTPESAKIIKKPKLQDSNLTQQTFIESQTAIQQMIYDQSTISLEARIKVQLHSDEFWNNLKFIIRILKPIVATLKAFEANNSTISTTYSCFNMLLTKIQKISCSYSAEIQQKIQNCWNYIYHPIMTIAFLLDPNYLKESKTNNHESDCLSTFANFISLKYPNEEASKIYAELLKFCNKQIPYNNELIWNSAIYLNPSTW